MAGRKRAPRKKRRLLLGEKERWVSGCVVFFFLLFASLVLVLVYGWLAGRG